MRRCRKSEFVPSLTAEEGAFANFVSYGHVGAPLITLASMLRIPVCMHNVPQDRILRPSTYTAFGENDPIGADYWACTNFGPLYR